MILEAREIGFGYPRGRTVLDGVSLGVTEGRGVAVVGESGAGKTTLLRILLGLLRPTTGEVAFDGEPLRLGDRTLMRRFRRSVQTVFQDPYSSLDPRQRVGRIVAEPLRSLGLEATPDRVTDALREVGLPPDVVHRYPHEFSGGQRQRIAIARAIVCRPRLLLADEPVSALDVTTRVRIVDLLAELRETRNLTVVMVTHDLAVAALLCQETVVLTNGRVAERGDTASVLGSPTHPYTRRLLASVPRLPAAAPAPPADDPPAPPASAADPTGQPAGPTGQPG